jgi:hypothetical protein
MHQICVRSVVASEELFTRVTNSTPAWQGRRSLPLGLIVNADSMLVRNPASLGIENQWTKCVKMFRSNCIDFSPTTTKHYTYSTIKAPDKGAVGGSSPPRPTIQITSKYAAILTFPLFGDLPQKTVLSTVCHLYDWPDCNTLRGVKTLRVKAEQLASIWLCRECRPVRSKDVQGSARHCKLADGAGRHF